MAHSWRVRRVGARSKPRRARARLTVSVERPPRVRRWPCHGSFQRIHTTATQVNQPPPPPPPFDTATTTAHLYAVYPTRPPISKRGEAFLKVSAGLAAGAGSGSRSARAATRRTLSNVHEHTLHTPPTATPAHHASLSPTAGHAPRRAEAYWCLPPMRWWRGRQGRKLPAPSAHRTLCP